MRRVGVPGGAERVKKDVTSLGILSPPSPPVHCPYLELDVRSTV